MKTFNKLLAAAVLASVGVAALAAEPIENDFFIFPTASTGLTQIYELGDDFQSTAGTSFTDVFLFNLQPPDANISFNIASLFDDNSTQEVSFTGFSLTAFQPGEDVQPVPLQSTFSSFFISGKTFAPLDVGIYELEITGTVLTGDVASYVGLMESTIPSEAVPSPVPESETWALMLLGLGAVGAAVRRR